MSLLGATLQPRKGAVCRFARSSKMTGYVNAHQVWGRSHRTLRAAVWHPDFEYRNTPFGHSSESWNPSAYKTFKDIVDSSFRWNDGAEWTFNLARPILI